MLADLSTPDEILADLWQRLSLAATDTHRFFRNLTLCSLTEDGEPEARTVVLRRADPANRTLSIHTDRRSPKVGELMRDGRATALFYDTAERLQLRIRLAIAVHTDDAIAQVQWEELPPRNQKVYATPLPPGSILPAMHTRVPPAKSTGREHFAVLLGLVVSIDWLYLHPDGHRRIRLSWPEETLSSDWLAP